MTGSEGLIGRVLCRRLSEAGAEPLQVDLRTPAPGSPLDLRDHSRMAALAGQADGIVHLGAVSRVVDAERDPLTCEAVNVGATRNLISAAVHAPRRPWFVYASSREVYGQQDDFPVREEAPFRPLNIYARSKVEAERLTGEARGAGLRTSIARFSSVYGSADDHPTRVVPAFVRAGIEGRTLRIEGDRHAFDLTHVEDVAAGLMTIIGLLHAGERTLPPIHFASGRAITLTDLAAKAIALGGSRAQMEVVAPRSYDVHYFVGDPARAEHLLDWRATTTLDVGLARLAADMRARGT